MSESELGVDGYYGFDGDWEAVAWRAMANLQKKIEDGYVPAGFEDEA